MRTLIFALAIAGLSASMLAQPVAAGDRGYHSKNGAHSKSRYYRKGPRVKGYSRRVGGYSYNAEDTINTYGDARSNYGSASVYRDQNLDRQTVAGPFDHGFFFDSGIAPHGGDSPYMN